MNSILLVTIQKEWFFDGWNPIVRTLLLGICAYIAIILMLKLSGKRTLSKMNSFDFIVTISLGSILNSTLVSNTVSLSKGLTAIAVLLILQFIISKLSVLSKPFQELIKSRPIMLFYRGQYLKEEMKKARVTAGELEAKARQNGIHKMEDVDAIVLESEGSLSIIKKLEDDKNTALNKVSNFPDTEK